MSLICRDKSAMKFYSIAYRGNFSPKKDVESLPVTDKLVAFRAMVDSVMKKGFENVLFDNKIDGYILKLGVNLEELLVDTGHIFINEWFDFERSMYRRVARDVMNILNQFCE